MRDACPDCQGAEGYCAGCGGGASFEALLGVCQSRGIYWAHEVAGKVTHHAPWPAFAGKARAIALRRVGDLGGNGWAREFRARACHRREAEAWAETSLATFPRQCR